MLRRARFPLGILFVFGVLTTCLASPAAADTPGARPSDRPSTWVALGDSFQSGVGAGEYNDASGDCRRSPASHVELLHADGVGPAELEFVACSGAAIEDLYAPRHGEPAQLDALDTDADISHVSVGIGGNDLDFADNLRDCILNGWPWSSCQSRLDDEVSQDFDALIAQNQDGRNAFQELYADIDGALGARQATVLALTYPRFFPADGGSDWTSIPFQPRCQGIRVSDQLWINNWIRRLNTVITDSAHSMGAVPVDLYGASDGHELCNPEGAEPYLNGIRLSSEAFHPTAFGYTRNAELLRPHLRTAVPQTSPPMLHRAGGPTELPDPPEPELRLTQEGDTVTVDAAGTTPGDGGVETYLWEFDDGTLADAARTTHTYTEPGTYHVTLTVIDSNEEMGFSEPYEVVVD